MEAHLVYCPAANCPCDECWWDCIFNDEEET